MRFHDAATTWGGGAHVEAARPPGPIPTRYVTEARRTWRKRSRLLGLTNMGLSNAERQRRHRERLKAGQPLSRVRYRRPKDRRSKARRWSDAVQELVNLQAEYQAWLDSLPENLQSSAVAEQLEAICELDLDSLQDVEPPRGFGRD